MAEVDFDEFEDAVYVPLRAGARSEQVQRWLNYAGAASSVALVLVLAVWGYRLAMRDVNGVPVMRALSGPMRIAPAEPGGQEASNQGLSVNAIASTGIASPVPDKVMLAPATTALTSDDKAGMAGPVAGQVAAVPLAADANAVLAPQSLPAPAAVDMQAGLGDGDTEAVDGGPDATAADAVNAAVSAAVAEAVGADAGAPPAGAVARSLVPRARPLLHIATPVASAAALAEVDGATIAVGTELAQLGTFPSAAEAQAKWTALTGQYAEVMAGKGLVIQQAQSGGKDFFRLRVQGFDTEDDARRFCAVLLAGNSDCVPLAQR